MEIGSIFKNRFKIMIQFDKNCRAYKCYDLKKKEFVVLKLRNFKKDTNYIYQEKRIYKDLEPYNLIIPKYLNYHSEYLKFELLGPSLADMKPPFSLKTVLMIGIQLISHLESLHYAGYLFNGVKPANFVMGSKLLNTQKGKTVFMIDFGLSGKMSREGCLYTRSGNSDYMSIYQDSSGKLYPINEFQSLAYVFLNLLTGSLPWEKDDIITCKKLLIKQYFMGFPKEFTLYCDYLNSVPINARVDYNYLKGLFQHLMKKKNYTFDYQYDWCAKPFIPLIFIEKCRKQIVKKCKKSCKNFLQKIKKFRKKNLNLKQK